MYSAQAQLADAYIAAGAATEARFIAEDLVAREPWDKSNIERFRRALVLLGEPDPDALIAAALERRVAVHEHRPVRANRSRQTPPEPEPAPPSEEESGGPGGGRQPRPTIRPESRSRPQTHARGDGHAFRN